MNKTPPQTTPPRRCGERRWWKCVGVLAVGPVVMAAASDPPPSADKPPTPPGALRAPVPHPPVDRPAGPPVPPPAAPKDQPAGNPQTPHPEDMPVSGDEVLRSAEYQVSVRVGNAVEAKVGTAREVEFRRGGQLHCVSVTDTRLALEGQAVIRSVSRSLVIETAEGRPLGFVLSSKIASDARRDESVNWSVRGVVAGDEVTLYETPGEVAPPPPGVAPASGQPPAVAGRKIAWPVNAVTPRALKARLLAEGLTVNQSVTGLVFPTPESPTAAYRCTLTVAGRDTLMWAGEPHDLARVVITAEIAGQVVRATEWIDPTGMVYQSELRSGQLQFRMLRVR